MTEQRRLRSNATALTTEQKKKLAKDAGITEEMDQNTAEEKMKRALDDKIKKDLDNNQYKMRRSYIKGGNEDHNKNLVTPKFFDIKKEYTSKGEKVYNMIIRQYCSTKEPKLLGILIKDW
jgi:hypothetical protein